MGTVELPPHLSYSQLSSYLQCGERFRLERLEGVPSRPSWAMAGGSAVHTVTEQLDRQMFDPTQQVQTFQEAFDEQVQVTIERSGFAPEDWYNSGRKSVAWPDKENRAWWEFHGPTYVSAWTIWRNATPGWSIWMADDNTPAIELGMTPQFDGVPVKMFIDRVFVTAAGELVVVDLKTGAREPGPDQLGLYAAGIEQMLGVRPKWGTYWMARKGGSTEVYDLDGYTKARLGHEYRTGRTAMESGIFLPHVGPLCGSCGVKDACYAVSGVRSADYAPFAI